LDKEYTTVIYKVCPNIKLTHTLNISKLKKILNFKKCYPRSKRLEIEPLGKLRLLPQIPQDSNLDKEFSQVIYKPCTTL
jgi:hypothetical protein